MNAREAYFREGPDQTMLKAIQDISYRCAKCSEEYPHATQCGTCIFNVAAYNGNDYQQAMTLRASCKAQQDIVNKLPANEYWVNEHRNSNNAIKVFIALGIIIVGVLIWMRLEAGTVKGPAEMYSPKQATDIYKR